LPDHSLLDQIVRGRAWIPLLGVLLAGIVAMQVEVLKLSANMGRSLERGTTLQNRNEQLQASVAQLADDQRIERVAAGMGMVMPPPTAVKFLPRSAAGQTGRALAAVHSPNPAAFAAALPGAQAAFSVGTTAMTTPSTAGAAPTLAQAAPAPVTSATTTPGVPSSSPSATTTPTSSTAPAATTPAASSAGTPASSAPPTYAPATSPSGAAAAGAAAPGAGG
jgi:hypothetical protein